MNVDRVPTGAHRISWQLHFGPIPLGMWVLHHCDNPPCVRPDHLFLGTHPENMADRMAKGRNVLSGGKGERQRSARLTERQVAEIREWAANGVSYHALARLSGVDPKTVQAAVLRKTWKTVA